MYEMHQNANFQDMFGSLSDGPNILTLEQDQIVTFCEIHKKWFRTGNYATFFLFKVGDEFFVAYVILCGNGHFIVHVRRLQHGYVWNADVRPRVVVPQL